MSISEEATDGVELYRHLASGRILERRRQEALGIQAAKERTEELLNSIAELPRGFGQHPVLKEWARQMRIVIHGSEEPEWNYRYEPNCRLIRRTLEDVKQLGEDEAGGLKELASLRFIFVTWEIADHSVCDLGSSTLLNVPSLFASCEASGKSIISRSSSRYVDLLPRVYDIADIPNLRAESARRSSANAQGTS